MTHLINFEFLKHKPPLRCVLFVLAAIVFISIYLNYKSEIENLRKISWKNEFNQTSNINLAEKLAHEVRVLCWILTTPTNHKNKAIHVRRTWGKRCNRLIFVTSEEDNTLGETLVLHNITDTHEHLWLKARRAFQHVYEKYGNEMDWFMKADDDTYVFVENLRYLLYAYNPDMPIYFGHNFNLIGKKKWQYMSGGAGYVLSRESLRRLVKIAIHKDDVCQPESAQTSEDVGLGMCLHAVGVIAGDSRDTHNELRFVPWQPFAVLIANFFRTDLWFYTFTWYHHRACQNCLSKHAIAFHYMTVEDMYLCEYFVYQFKLHDHRENEDILPIKLSLDQVKIPTAINSWNITIR